MLSHHLQKQNLWRFHTIFVAIFHTNQIINPLQHILRALRHPTATALIFTDNNVAKNLSMQQCNSIKTHTVNMKYFYTLEQIKRHNFQVHWLPGPVNQDDYFTKNAPTIHSKQRSTYVLNHARLKDFCVRGSVKSPNKC